MSFEAGRLSRRQFGLLVGGACCPLPLAADWEKEMAAMPWNGPAKVAKVYLGAPAPAWPKPTLDVKSEVAEIEARLGEVARKHAENVQFTGGEILRTAEEVKPWLAKTGDVDGVLIIPVAQPTPPLAALAGELRVPGLFFSRPYATHAWGAIGGYRKGGKKLEVVATSSYGDLDPYMRMFRTIHHLRTSKVIVGTAKPEGRQPAADAYRQQFGTAFQFFAGQEFRAAFNGVDEAAAKRETEAFVRGALRVVEPTPKEIHDGVKFYLGLREMLRREKANALTIDCFGTLAARTLPGYPCIAWSRLNDVGLYGVCEGDLHSTMTQMLVTSFAGVPGFVSDPVFDVSRNEVIHAHCVSATRLKGPRGPASPYIIRNHLETNEGAVLQVLMPSNETITVARFATPARMLISTAEVSGVVDSDRGCRTQIRTRVRDAESWLQNYTAGLHRVIFYGDHVANIQRMGRLMGFEVVREA